METIEIEKEVMEILIKLPSENICLDYKVEVYKTEKLADFIKDVIGFLNNLETENKNRYIIFGVSNDKKLIGLENKFIDDANLQELCKKIEPIPKIFVGDIKYLEKTFGYICISKRNELDVYEVAEDYITLRSHVNKGIAYIRRGSSNQILTKDERNEIFLKQISMGKNLESQIKLVIEANKKMIKDKCSFRDMNGKIQINLDENNGCFDLSEGQHIFQIKLSSCGINSVYIYRDRGIEIGYNEDINIEKAFESFEKFDYSNRCVCIRKDKYVLISNKKDNFCTLKLISANSKSHGSKDNRVELEYNIY